MSLAPVLCAPDGRELFRVLWRAVQPEVGRGREALFTSIFEHMSTPMFVLLLGRGSFSSKQAEDALDEYWEEPD